MKTGKILLWSLLLLFIGFTLFYDTDIFRFGSDIIDFVKVFSVWAIIVFPTIFLLNKYRTEKLSSNAKFFASFGTALIALFVWEMIKFDSEPFDGPIDSIVHKELNEKHRKQDSLWVAEGYPDSTIMETQSIDTNKNGIYIWLNHKEIFVRKHTTNFNSQRQEDSVTMSIVRGWAKINKSDSGNVSKK